MRIEVLAWKWPAAKIVVRGTVVVSWVSPDGHGPPTAPEYAAAEAEYEASRLGEAVVSKLALRRALRARGLEPVLKALLKSSETAADDWGDASTLRMDDPLLVAMVPAFKAQAGLTDADILALVEEARAE